MRFRMIALALSALSLLTAAAPVPHWVGVWASAQMAAEPANQLEPAPLDDATVRQIVHITGGGGKIRIRLSNAFGRQPLHVAAVHLARAVAPGSADVVAGSDHTLSFSSHPDITLPPGGEFWSDPVEMPVPTFADLAVSFYLPKAPHRQTGHGDARATGFVVRGNHVDAPALPDATRIGHWFQLSGIAVEAQPGSAAVVALGDSITDSYMSTVDGNDRWPDILAERLHARTNTRHLSVLNEGLGGNRVLTDGLGPRLTSRLDRDLFSLPGVKTSILLIGVNDLGSLTREHPVSPAEHALLVRRLLAAYRQIILQAHQHGIRVIGGTIMPYAGSSFYHPDSANEADRRQVNSWIRAAGHFDGVIDFDLATRDPARPDRLLAAYDSGDHIHPSVAGYRAMANAIPLDLLTR